ncbi:hypothetical protein [Pontibacter sp. SGAir0037]|uniref:hypothetical protein n=1 Tax=Pontibacter sp. SGAir0037 TaxID=2571030 RepID=UPI001F0DAE1A|nr:hypothetical protein [Pontibacter sp. SGAir0037]
MIATENKVAFSEVFSTASGAVLQCDYKNRLLLQFDGTVTPFKVEAFLRLKKIVDRIDLVAMASSTDRFSDFEIIYPVGCERVYILALADIIALKELLAGAKAMLEINSMLHELLNPVMA